MDRHQRDSQLLERFQSQYRSLTTQLAEIGFIWGGSVQSQWLTCGTPGCACHGDPQARHGPYIYWTSKVAGRTVSRLLRSPRGGAIERMGSEQTSTRSDRSRDEEALSESCEGGAQATAPGVERTSRTATGGKNQTSDLRKEGLIYCYLADKGNR